jgi:drug/metabolite transporter (DMT)-like permease
MRPVYGITLKVLSALAFTIMSAIVKALSTRYPVGQLIFCRSFFALIPLIAWLAWLGTLGTDLKTRNIGGHVSRGLVGSTGMLCGFFALSYLPLPDAVAISYAAPLLVVVFAALFLQETVRIYRWSAVAVGFVGVLLMLSPHLGGSTGPGALTGAGFALAGAVCSAAAMTLVRKLTATETTGAIVFYFTIMSTVVGLSTIVFGWLTPLGAGDAALMVVTGIMGGVGQILLTMSYRHGDASLIAPFEYTTMIWALALGWLAFGDVPTLPILIGACIVIGAGLFVIWREKQLGLLKPETRQAGPATGK